MTQVDTSNVKMSMNSFGEIALEEVVYLKERDSPEEVVLVSIIGTHCQETLRVCLAMGAGIQNF
jgi:electron transfer flavoprotein alpha/beta subunit